MNEAKFTGKANIYSKYRPSYPDGFIEYLYSEVGITKESVIADIGSGTGILTDLLLRQNSYVYGVEPNKDMRNIAEKELTAYDNFVSVNASAENTGLLDDSVDYITVAQAFHWFDRIKFKSECKRILKSQGKVILVWNSRDDKSELFMKNESINRKFCPDFKGFSDGMRGESPEEYSDFFKDGICEYKTFRCDLMFDEDSFIGRNMSASYAPERGDSNYEPYILELKKLYEEYSVSGSLCMPNITKSYVGEV